MVEVNFILYVCLSGNLIIWKNKKLNIVVLLGADAEFQAMVQTIIREIYLKDKFEAPMKLICDNKIYTTLLAI